MESGKEKKKIPNKKGVNLGIGGKREEGFRSRKGGGKGQPLEEGKMQGPLLWERWAVRRPPMKNRHRKDGPLSGGGEEKGFFRLHQKRGENN